MVLFIQSSLVSNIASALSTMGGQRPGDDLLPRAPMAVAPGSLHGGESLRRLFMSFDIID
jgi:hypothetical protein